MYSQRVNQFLLFLIFLCMPLASVIHAQSDQTGGSKNNSNSTHSTKLAQFFNHTRPICDFDALQNLSVHMEANGAYEVHEWPSCKGVTLHAPNWISFVAGSDEFSLEIDVSECMKENGVQFAVYKLPDHIQYGENQKGLYPSKSLIGSSITGCYYAQNPQKGKIKFTTQTTPGEIFGLLIDGWNGDQCKLKFNVLKGETLSSLPPKIDGNIDYEYRSSEMQGDTICTGSQSVPFQLYTEMDNAPVFIWTLNGTPLPDEQSLGKNAYVNFNEEGMNSVCVRATNHCDTTDPLCIDVPVKTIRYGLERDTICQGESFGWWKGNELINLFGPFGSFKGDTSFYHTFKDTAAQCMKEWRMPLNVRDVNEESPIKLDTFARFSDMPIALLDTILDQPVDDLIISTTEGGTVASCKKYYDLELCVLGGKFSTELSCHQGNMEFTFSGIEDSSFYSPWEEQFNFINGNPYLDFAIKWKVNGRLLPYESKVISIQKDSLWYYSENGIVTIEQILTISNDDFDWLHIAAPELSISLSDYFPEFVDIRQEGDSIIVIEEDFSDYQWLNCETNSPILGENQSVFVPREKGSFQVRVSQGTCFSFSDCIDFIPVQNSESESLRIFPNPAKDYISIMSGKDVSWPARISIYSSTAKEIINILYNEGDRIDLSSLPRGVYFLNVEDHSTSFAKSE